MKELTDSIKDQIVLMSEKGMDVKDICNILQISTGSVYRVNKIAQMVKNDELEKAKEYSKNHYEKILTWALKKYGKRIPKEQVQNISTPTQIQMGEIVVKEEPAVIEKNQMGRIMLALGKLNEQSEILNTKFDLLIELMQTLIKNSNANADNSFRLLQDTKGAVVEGLRKMRKI